MESPTLVVSNPPHGEVDLDEAAELLGLDIFITRLKINFRAPEVLSFSDAGEALDFTAKLRDAGIHAALLDGRALLEPPWPDPVSSLAFDDSALRVAVGGGSIQLPYDQEVVGICCQPPDDFSMKPTVDPARAVASGHGPTISAAIQWMPNLDLYYREGGTLRRISIVPELSDVDAASVLEQVERRFHRLHLDTRLVGVRPRQRFVMGEAGFDADQRKRYSFGTLLLCHVLDTISPELRELTQYELGSRMGVALSPLGKGGG